MHIPFRMPTFDVEGDRFEPPVFDLESDQDLLGFEHYEAIDDIECGQRDRDLDLLVAAGEIHRCAKCGCTELTACPGGCVWATENLCSRCA